MCEGLCDGLECEMRYVCVYTQNHACVNVHTYGCVEIMMSETKKIVQMNCLKPLGTKVKNMVLVSVCVCVILCVCRVGKGVIFKVLTMYDMRGVAETN